MVLEHGEADYKASVSEMLLHPAANLHPIQP
jgi:hypothetical protein